MTAGIVKRFDNRKGYDFISYGDTEETFAYPIAIEEEGFKTLEEDQVVELEIIEGDRGTQAVHAKKGNVQTTDTSMHE